MPTRSHNRLLELLPAADFELLRPHLKPFELKHETILFEAGDPVHRVYFPVSGVISLVVDLAGVSIGLQFCPPIGVQL
jgi:CRP-like cAMP-binding protein